MTAEQRKRVFELFTAHAADSLTPDEHAELQETLRRDAEARRLWFVHQDVEMGLHAHLSAEPVVALKPAAKPTRYGWRPLAAAVALVLMGGLWFGLERTKAAAPFATLMATTNARWSDPNVELALSSGERIASALRLESGRAEFQMVDGATVVIEGPASVRFGERKVVFVDQGRVFCKCPTPESRLSVITPQTKVVDLGTEFSVEARADESTRVAVLSGKVDVKSPNAGVLTAGEAVDVRRSSVVRLQPLTPDEMAALMPRVVSAQTAHEGAGQNRLTDPGFEKPLPYALWRGTDDCLEHAPSIGRSGNAVRIRARGKHYPLVKQRVETGEIAGKVVQASVWAMSPADDPISERQFAVLKIAFLDSEGREFACSTRHFLHEGLPRGLYVSAQLAAQVPAGTRKIEVQLMLAASRGTTGSVCFDDASLVVAADAAK